MEKRGGFTLIELMIVVAIIGILASVAMPTFFRYKERVRDSEADMMLGAMFTGALAYWNEEKQSSTAFTAVALSQCIAGEGVVPSSGEFLAGLPGAKFVGDFKAVPGFVDLNISGPGPYFHLYGIAAGGLGGQCNEAGNVVVPDGASPYVLFAVRPLTGTTYRVGTITVARKGDELIRTPGVSWLEVPASDVGSMIQ